MLELRLASRLPQRLAQRLDLLETSRPTMPSLLNQKSRNHSHLGLRPIRSTAFRPVQAQHKAYRSRHHSYHSQPSDHINQSRRGSNPITLLMCLHEARRIKALHKLSRVCKSHSHCFRMVLVAILRRHNSCKTLGCNNR